MSPSGSRNATPFRLLHLVLDLDPGGTQRLVIEMSKRLQSRAEIQVCCLDRLGEWSSELIELGIPVHSLARQPGFRPTMAFRIAEVMRKHRTQVLHCHQYTPFVYGALASRLSPRPRLIFTEHGRVSDAPPSGKRQLANRLFGHLGGQLFAVSHELRSHLVAEGLPENRLSVIYNGIDPGPEATPETRALARSRLDISPDDMVIGTVARLDPVKDLGTLVQGFSIAARELPSAKLVLIGDGSERGQLEHQVAELALDEKVRFLGNREDVRQLLPGMDIFANTSTTEGISLTILEAMAAALPVVATQVGGTPEIIVDKQSGLLIEPASPASLAAALSDLAQSADRRAFLGSAARQRIESQFTLASMVEGYVQAYDID